MAEASSHQPLENLKFFPKDIARDSLLTFMRGFTYALGVNCAFCHVEEPATQPGGRPRLRPALDDKTEKQTARFMLAMVDTLNRITLANVPKRHEARSHHVRHVSPWLAAAGYDRNGDRGRGGPVRTGLGDRAISEAARDADERTLRLHRIPGEQSRRATLADRGKTDAAIALLEMNQEFNPNLRGHRPAARRHLREGRATRTKRSRAIRRRCTKRPNDPRARQGLTRLGKPPA